MPAWLLPLAAAALCAVLGTAWVFRRQLAILFISPPGAAQGQAAAAAPVSASAREAEALLLRNALPQANNDVEPIWVQQLPVSVAQFQEFLADAPKDGFLSFPDFQLSALVHRALIVAHRCDVFLCVVVVVFWCRVLSLELLLLLLMCATAFVAIQSFCFLVFCLFLWLAVLVACFGLASIFRFLSVIVCLSLSGMVCVSSSVSLSPSLPLSLPPSNPDTTTLCRVLTSCQLSTTPRK